MSEYHSFNKKKFEEELPEGFEEINVDGTKEYVYEKSLDDEYVIRVHSSVDIELGRARESGSDAIRVSLYHKPSDTIAGYDSKTLRIMNENGEPRWPTNMREKIEKLEEEYKNFIYKCPFCDSLLKKIDVNGGFFGCSNYPECRYIAEIDKDGEPVIDEIQNKFKRAYQFLVRKHDKDNCDKCQGKANWPDEFHNSLYHYLIENGELSEKQFKYIKDDIPKTLEKEKNEKEVKKDNWQFPLDEEPTDEEKSALEELMKGGERNGYGKSKGHNRKF